jgi:hypothetical protein
MILNPQGEPISAPAPTIAEPAKQEPMSSERHAQEANAWHWGGPDWLGIKRQPELPLGVSIQYDGRIEVFVLRDEFRLDPVVGWSESREPVLAFATSYVAKLGWSARLAEKRNQIQDRIGL